MYGVDLDTPMSLRGLFYWAILGKLKNGGNMRLLGLIALLYLLPAAAKDIGTHQILVQMGFESSSSMNELLQQYEDGQIGHFDDLILKLENQQHVSLRELMLDVSEVSRVPGFLKLGAKKQCEVADWVNENNVRLVNELLRNRYHVDASRLRDSEKAVSYFCDPERIELFESKKYQTSTRNGFWMSSVRHGRFD